MKKCVLIGGLPRSGTTLLETIIGSHTKISIPPGDFPFVEKYYDGLNVEQFFTNLSNKGTWKLWSMREFTDLYAKGHKYALRETLTRYAKSIDKEICGAKAPHSEFYFDTYLDWLEDFEVKFIHIIRNPFDVLASLKNSSYHTYSEESVSPRSKNWVRSTSLGLARHRQSPQRYYAVKYEDVIQHPEDTCKKICSFLQVDFEKERMLNRVDYPYHDTNTSFQKDVNKAKGNDYIYIPGDRKRYLTRFEIKIIGDICGEVAHALEYKDVDFRSSLPERTQHRLYYRIKRKLQSAIPTS